MKALVWISLVCFGWAWFGIVKFGLVWLKLVWSGWVWFGFYNPQTNNFYHPKVEVKKPFSDRNYFEVHLKDPYNLNSENPHQQQPPSTNVQTYPSSPNYSSNQPYLSDPQHPQNSHYPQKQNPNLLQGPEGPTKLNEDVNVKKVK